MPPPRGWPSRSWQSQGIDLPFITTLHGTDITLVGRDPSFEPVITFSMERSNAVTAVSESLKQDTYKHFPVKRGRAPCDPQFHLCGTVPAVPIRSCASAMHPMVRTLLVHVSNFRAVKRVEDVVAMFNLLRERLPASCC